MTRGESTHRLVRDELPQVARIMDARTFEAAAAARRNLAYLPVVTGTPSIRYCGLGMPHGWWGIREGPNGVETLLHTHLTDAFKFTGGDWS